MEVEKLPMTESDWEAAEGPKCEICGRETFRIYPNVWGEMVCPQCLNENICPHVRRSRYADILVSAGIRVCRLCNRLDRA